MFQYFIRRLFSLVPLILGITLLTFLIMHLTPGKATDIMTESQKVSAESKQRLVKLYGLDKPWYEQYFDWLKRIVCLDFGRSFRDDRPVIDKIKDRIPITLFIEILSLLIIFLIAIPLGVFSAIRRNSLFDKITTVFVFAGYSISTIWLSLILMILFGLKLGWLPISGIHSLNYDNLSLLGKIWDLFKHLVLPVFIISFTGLAGLSRYSRTSMLEVIHQDYVRTARAKGLSEKQVIFKHAFRNALIPLVTILGLSLPGLISGGFIFETIFAIPGMGRLGYEAIMARDYPVVMGTGIIVAFLTLLGNFLADMIYAMVDPRIRYK